MQRAIVTPAILPNAALDELKQWLAITSTREDAALTQLLRAALETCEAFTRAIPLAATYVETHKLEGGWQQLGLMPVRAITGLEGIAANGTRTTLPVEQYLVDLTSDQVGQFRLLTAANAVKVAVTYTAGIAADWASLPAGLRHGIIRLAAHHFRAREADTGSAMPPAVVAALWQPFRRMRLT